MQVDQKPHDELREDPIPAGSGAPTARAGDDTKMIILRQTKQGGVWKGKAGDIALGFGAVVLALILWEVLARTGALPASAFPSASEVAVRLVALIPTAAFWTAVGQTISGAAIGLVIVIVLAVPLGMAIGRMKWFDRSTILVVEFLKPIPPVALLPLALLFWGPSPTMKIFLVCMGAIWPLLVQIVYGARSVDQTQLDMARSYRFSRAKTLRNIVLPGVTPYALTGLRVSATIAVIVAVVAELIGGAPGLGQQVSLAQTSADLPTMYAYIITTGLLGLAVNGLFVLLNKPLLFWHPSQRKEG